MPQPLSAVTVVQKPLEWVGLQKPPKQKEGFSLGRTIKPLADGYVNLTKTIETTDGLHNAVQGITGAITSLSGGNALRVLRLSLSQVDVFIERIKIPQYLSYFFKNEFSEDLKDGKYAAAASGLAFGAGSAAGIAEFASWLGIVDYTRIAVSIGSSITLCSISLYSFTLGYLFKAVQIGWDVDSKSPLKDYLNMAASMAEVASKVYLIFLVSSLTPVVGAVVGGFLALVAAGFGFVHAYYNCVEREVTATTKTGHKHVPPHGHTHSHVYRATMPQS